MIHADANEIKSIPSMMLYILSFHLVIYFLFYLKEYLQVCVYSFIISIFKKPTQYHLLQCMY